MFKNDLEVNTEAPTGKSMTKETARGWFKRLQTVTGLVLMLSSLAGVYLLATDNSLWLLALSHAVGLVVIVVIDGALGIFSLLRSKGVYLASLAAAVLGITLQLGDIATAPQYNMTVAYFARYLFGLWAFDILLGLLVSVIAIGVLGRPYARYLARRKSRRGRELNYTRRGFMKSAAALAGLVGLGVVLGSVKLPTPPPGGQTTTTSTTRSGTMPSGAVANRNTLKVGSPVYFEYPRGYPNILMLKQDGSLEALSMLCTHVCCQSYYETTADVIYCPCHGSIFDTAGKVVRGPAAYNLPSINLRVDSSGYVYPVGVSSSGPCQI